MNKKVVALSGSLRPQSSSHVVLEDAGRMLTNGITFDMFDGIGKLPHFDGREEDAPESVLQFRNKIREADGILICTPEYAFGIPGSLKNALDWTVGTGDFVDKPVALITASSQGERGHEALQWVLKAISAQLTPDTTLLISFVRAKVKEGQIIDPATRDALFQAMQAFQRQINGVNTEGSR